ncbi:hypothetical protein F4778DRAFT_798771 [Xylariomycetidae sp. FL2044]|nr:hypothetical protein F4778DRAFT_801395 [Xylariomycetidae sp. FL2044]KAH9885633.1 hypothetical protein F4778DRAFT_798771 [Xylariomycetidae sp. FL2044]
MDAAGARHVGARLLGEVEEESLEELLNSLRSTLNHTSSHHPSPEIPIPELSHIVSRYQKATQSAPPPIVSVSGRYLPFLYHLISTLIAEPHNYTVVVVDAESKFDVTRLVGGSEAPSRRPGHPATAADLRHVHVYRPARGQDQIKAALAGAQEWMLHGRHGSRDREWWGTVVIGGIGGHVNAGWKGWMRVEREEIGGFAIGMSVEEALRDRTKRQDLVDGAGWVAGSLWGSYVWKDV